MRYKVYDNGELINTIVADAIFSKIYAENTGYTLELEGAQDEATLSVSLEALAAENAKLKAQLKLQSEHQTFIEDCILEMADSVYA